MKLPLEKISAATVLLRRALGVHDLAYAIRIHRALFPPSGVRFIRETDERDLREYLETPLPVFSFCSEEELHELRIRMAIAVCLQIRSDQALQRDASFLWPYPMSLKAAAQNFFKTTMVHGNVAQWRKSGLVRSAKILNSADSPCRTCKAAAEREYAIDSLPMLPLHICENLNTVGCRCSVVATKIAGLSRKW